MASFITKLAHGLVAGDAIYFGNLIPSDCGIVEGRTYYVLAAGLTANTFEFSETDGGTPFTLTYDITDGIISKVAVYTAITDVNDVHAPPVAPSAPGSCVLSSAAVLLPDGTTVSRLDITITQPTSATLRHTVVTITGGSNAVKVVIPVGQTTGSIASVVPGLTYTGSAVAYDTFGLSSSATVSAGHVAAGDVTAPAQVTSAAALGAIRAAFVSWAGSAATDLSHYEVQIDSVNTFATATTYKVKVSMVSFAELAVGTWYFRIRAVDLTGNLGAYSATVSATSRLVTGGSDIVANSITANDILAGSVTADRLSVGARPSGNRILNPSFEDFVSGFPLNWFGANGVQPGAAGTGYETTGTGASFSSSTSTAASGLRHAKISAAAATGGAIASKSFPVAPGERYYVSAHVNSDNITTKGLYIRVIYHTLEDGERLGAGLVSFVDVFSDVAYTGSGWVQYDGYVTIPATAVYARVLLYNWQPNVTNALYFDNIVMERMSGGIINSDGNVTIDASGLTVTNGKVTIQDANGTSVLTASGFAGPWLDFIHLGLYNARFLQGVVGTIPNGTTSACPYWTFSNVAGSPVATFISGGGMEFTPNALNASKRLISAIVPVRPGAEYAVTVAFKATIGAGFEQVETDIFWFKADGTTAASVANDGGLIAAGAGTTIAVASFDVGTATAPPDAMYAKVYVTITEILSHHASNNLTLAAIGLTEAPPKNLMNGASGSQRYVNDLEVNGDLSVDSNFALIGTRSYPTMGCRALRTSNQTVTGPGGAAMLSFNAADDYDAYSMHDPSGTPTRVTAIWDGKYEIVASAHCAPVATLPTRLILELFKNGSAVPIGGVAGTGQRLIMPNAQTFDQHMQGTWFVNLAAGDYIEIHVEHNSATSQTVKAAEVMMTWQGN